MQTQSANQSGWEPVTDPNELKSVSSDNSGWQPVTDQNEINQVNGYPDANLKGGLNIAGRAAGIFNKDIESAPEKIGKWLIEKLNVAPSEASGALSQEFTDPKRYGKNIVTGIGAARNTAVNLPSQIPNYLAHLGLITPETANKFPHATENLTNMFSPEEQKQPGDAFLQGYPGALPLLPESAGLATSAISSPVKTLIHGGEKYRALQDKVLQSQTEHTTNIENLKNAQDQARASGVPTTVGGSVSKLYDNQQKLNDLQQNLTENPVPKTVEEAQNIHENAKNLVDETKNNLGKHLNEGTEFDVNSANRIEQIEKSNRQGISKGFDALENDWDNRQVKIDNTQKIQDKNDELMDIIKSGGARSPEATDILGELENLKNEKSVSAKDYLHAYRSVSQYAREARQKAYQPGMNQEERSQWKQKYDDLDSKVDEMGATLEDSVGKDEFEKLQKLNGRWRNEVVPLYGNNIFQRIVRKGANQGTMSDNIIKSLRGKDAGNAIIKNIIKSDPELLKNVVGQRYAIKPSEVLNPNSRMKEYTDLMPEMNQFRDQHLAAKEAVGSSKEALDNSQKYNENRTEIDKTQDEIHMLDKNIQDLSIARSRKNLSLKEKNKVERDFARAQKMRRAKMIGLYAIGGYKLYKGSQALMNAGSKPEGE